MLDRRSVLRRAAALAAANFLCSGRLVAEPSRLPHFDADPFGLGVASGEPAHDGFVLWTRIAGLRRDALVGVEIAEDDQFRRIVRSGEAVALSARGGAVHLEVKHLRPGRPYWYRFELAGARSPTGRTITVPLRPDAVRLALTSCQHWEQGWFTAYADMIRQQADAVLQVGDYIYEKSFGSGPNVRAFGSPVPRSLEDFRRRHALYRSDPNLAAAHAAMPFVVTWDDHEVENDYAADQGLATPGGEAFHRLRSAAYQAYFEHMPLRPSSLRHGSEHRVYRRIGWGDLATIHLLDTRQYRSGLACPTPEQRGSHILKNCPDMARPDWTMLGAAQEAWLRHGLAAERGRWSLLTQQTLFARFFLPGGDDQVYSDFWDAFAATRERTLAALSQPAVRNPVVLSGDVHSFWVNDLKENFDRSSSPTLATELVTSCLAARNAPEALLGPAKSLNPHVRFLDNAHSGYVLIDVRRDALRANMRAVVNLADPRSACRSLGRYVIENGRPGAVAG